MASPERIIAIHSFPRQHTDQVSLLAPPLSLVFDSYSSIEVLRPVVSFRNASFGVSRFKSRIRVSPLMHVVFDGQMALLENSLSRYTRNLVQNLAHHSELRLTLLVFSPRSPEQVRLSSAWIPERVEIRTLQGPETPYLASARESWLRTNYYVPKALRELKAQIYHTHYRNFGIPIGYRVVTTLHDVFQWVPALQRPGRLAWLRLFLDRVTYRCASALVCVSESTRTDFLRYVDSKHSRVFAVHSGVDPIFSPQREEQDDDVLSGHQLKSKRFLLYVGDLQPRKDVLTAVRAFRRALGELPADVDFVIVGGDWGKQVEREYTVRHGLEHRVRFLGRVEDHALPTLYRHARAFVFPSLYEGFGFPPLEAMASGTPVITTNISALPEVVGHAGLLFEPGDVDGLKSLIVKAVYDEPHMALLAQEGVVRSQAFRWETTARRILEIYHKIA